MKNHEGEPILKTHLTVIAVFSGLALNHTASAHDAWIELTPEVQPDQSDATWKAEFYIGHAEDRDPYAADAARVSGFFSVDAAGITDHLKVLAGSREENGVAISFNGSEDQILALSTFRAVSELGADKFNAYVEEEGIVPIEIDRLQTRTTEQPGREIYSRYLKAIPDFGDDSCDISFLSQPIGQLLEIIPVTHPGKGCSDDMTFELRYFGEPVANATLHWNRTDEKTPPVKVLTDKMGHATFNRPEDGMWYVHAAWSRPIEQDRFNADFATTFSSLSMSFD